jgi:uncharacterized DUF497 family protein
MANIARHGMDFTDLDETFFERSVLVPTKLGRQIAVGRHPNGIILVVVCCARNRRCQRCHMRRASRKERRLIDG